MVICNQVCAWNRYKHGCTKPLPVACPLEAALGNTGVANENPITNGDRVRAMSDEELGRFLAAVENRRSAAGGGAFWKGAAHAIEWLKQPAEEEK